MDAVLAVIIAACLNTLKLLGFMFGPVFAAALLMYGLSSHLGSRAMKSIGYKAYAWLTAPGTVVHELGHAIFCLIFLHKIDEISLFHPEPDGTLGYVKHAWDPASLYQRVGNFFIGTGPIWFGCAVVYLLSLVLVGKWFFMPLVNFSVQPSDIATWKSIGGLALLFFRDLAVPLGDLFNPDIVSGWKFWLFLYLTFCIGIHMSLSPSDLKGAGPGFALLVVGLLLTNFVAAIIVATAPGNATLHLMASLTAWLASFALTTCGILLFTMTPALAISTVVAVIGAVSGRCE